VGIAADRLPTVLESGSGTGLGIALKNVDDRIRGHFGPESGVRVESSEGAGTAVSLVIARADRCAELGRDADTGASTARKNATGRT
jgi:two-component system sensor histidine kinase LytS